MREGRDRKFVSIETQGDNSFEHKNKRPSRCSSQAERGSEQEIKERRGLLTIGPLHGVFPSLLLSPFVLCGYVQQTRIGWDGRTRKHLHPSPVPLTCRSTQEPRFPFSFSRPRTREGKNGRRMRPDPVYLIRRRENGETEEKEGTVTRVRTVCILISQKQTPDMNTYTHWTRPNPSSYLSVQCLAMRRWTDKN